MTIVLILFSFPTKSQQKNTEPVLYKGRIVNEKEKPLSGIFPLTFTLHKSEKDKKPVWKESFFVAVDKGIFTVELGRANPMPTGVKLSDLYIALSLKDKAEILREKFMPQEVPKVEIVKNQTEKTASKETEAGGEVSYAKTAGFAAESEHAKNADMVMNMTVEDILMKLKETGTTGSESTGKAKIGTSRRFTNLIGGTGGEDWSETCPKGYVVVGAKGKSGNFIDAIQFICAPIE
jgi:hypothetical protein